VVSLAWRALVLALRAVLSALPARCVMSYIYFTGRPRIIGA